MLCHLLFTAYSLNCHVCNTTTANTCTNPINCSTADHYCTTFITTHALQCYTCLEPMSASLCVTISNCSTDDVVCKTVMYSREEVYPFVGDSTVVKSCAQKCIPSDVDEIGSSRPTFCCNSDLCNLDGAVSIQISYMVMGISASFLCVLLRTGL
ncbi:ly6/PLAUR domain-containing protein 2-like isoform X1 [Chelonoidis abingdonii]|uniref:ly6/PLAUR domain-containing protein 2-like isoform X1 n=1 Tax=Chelonoidis abingdonii TaxID=106734 RepID=UPI0013F1E6E3|nr:ly6/PLAUR domain-containing protein 2-like isoform X1 [Chelonoidis abingdonii]